MNYKLLVPTYRTRYLVTFQALDYVKKKGKNARILHVGCGEGEYDSHIAEYCGKLDSVDINPKDIEYAQNLNAQNTKICHAVENAEDLSFKDGSFDSVVCIDILEHVGNPVKVIKEMSRVLKKGGYLILTVPHHHFPYTYDPLNRLLRRIGIRIPFGAYGFGHERLIQLENIKELLLKSGFIIKKQKYLSHYLIGLLEMYWTSILQRMVKSNSHNQVKAGKKTFLMRPTKEAPLLTPVVDFLIQLDKSLFGWSHKSIGLFFLSKKK